MTIDVAILDPLSKHGGMHYYVHDQAEALEANGLRVGVFSPPTGLSDQAHYRQEHAFEGVYGNDPKLKRATRLIRDYVAAVRSARRQGARACIFHIFKSNGFETFGIIAARAVGMRVFCVIHDVARLDAASNFSLIKQIATLSDGMVVHNAYSRDALLAAAPNAKRNAAIIPHGNYVDRFPTPPSEADARAALGLPADGIILLFFGNSRREKGLHVLLDAMVGLRDIGVKLVVAGKMSAAEAAEAHGFVAEHGLESVVRLDIGHVADDQVANYYRSASIVALPYLRVYESGVALMAMSFSRPIIASDLPVFKDVVESGGGGVLFKAGDAAALREAIVGLAAGRQDCASLGEKARRFAVEERDWRRLGAQWVALIGK